MTAQHQTFLTLLHQNLRVLRARAVRYAGDAPLDLLNQIADHEQALELTEAVERGEIGELAWRDGLIHLAVRQPAEVFSAVRVIYNLPDAPIAVRSVRQRCADLADHIGETLDLIKGYEDQIRLNDDPRTIRRAERAMADLGRQLGGYEAEAGQLGCDDEAMGGDEPPQGGDLPESVTPSTTDGLTALCPYRGLFAFRPEDAPYFFGRVDDTADLIEAVWAGRLVTVLGASGSGKSSLVFAGLVPALLSSGGWRFTTCRPGNDPCLALAGALTPLYETSRDKTDQLLAARKLANGFLTGDLPPGDVLNLIRQNAPDQRLLLIIDQFEELYTLCPQPDTRRHFLDLLLTLVEQARAYNLHLLLTLRADFLSQASLYPPFADLIKPRLVLLRPMTRPELAEAVEQPATLQGLQFEDGLVNRLLNDVGQDEGSLPLLEFALTELWQRRANGRLTHAAYDQIGGVTGALSEHADTVFRRLEPEEKEQVRRIFIQLVQPGAGTGDTRRLATQPEIKADWTLVARLAGERLIVTNRPPAEDQPETVEVVHEALIRHWGQLQRWLETDREFRAWQEGLRALMQQWQVNNRDPGALLRGALLAVAQEQLADRVAELSDDEIAYIQASIDQTEASQMEEEARRRRELAQAHQLAEEAEARRRAEAQRAEEAEARQQAEAQRADEQAQSAAILRRRAMWLAGVTLIAGLLGVIAVIFGVQSKAAAKAEGTARSIAVTREAEAQEQANIALSRQLAAQGKDLLEENPHLAMLLALEGQSIVQTDETAIVIDQARYVFSPLRASFLGHTDGVSGVVWSPDGQQLASSAADRTIIVWDVLTGKAGTTLRGHADAVLCVVWSPDGQQLASGADDGTIIVWDVQTGEASTTLRGHAGSIRSVAWSPAGTQLASGANDGTIIVWDMLTGKVSTTLRGHTDAVRAVVWSPDGKELASGAEDGTIIVWDVLTGEASTTLRGHTDGVLSVAWSPDGQQLASGAADGTIIIWDMLTREASITLRGHAGAVRSVTWSPDGQQLASGANDRTIIVWDMQIGEAGTTLRGHTGWVWSVVWSPDGQQLASGADDRVIIIWDVQTGEASTTLRGHTGWVWNVAWSPGGQQLASGGDDGTITIWDVQTGEAGTTLRGHAGSVRSVAWSPDGQQLASGAEDGTIIVWDVQIGEASTTLRGHAGSIRSVAWSLDGQQLASGAVDRTIIVWDMQTGEADITLRGHADAVLNVAWSPDGQQLASGAADRTIRIIQSWALRPPCELVTRNLTLAEWRRYLGDRPYHATCPNHPALDQVGQP